MVKWTDGWMDSRIDGQMDGEGKIEKADRWLDRRTDKQTDKGSKGVNTVFGNLPSPDLHSVCNSETPISPVSFGFRPSKTRCARFAPACSSHRETISTQKTNKPMAPLLAVRGIWKMSSFLGRLERTGGKCHRGGWFWRRD